MRSVGLGGAMMKEHVEQLSIKELIELQTVIAKELKHRRFKRQI